MAKSKDRRPKGKNKSARSKRKRSDPARQMVADPLSIEDIERAIKARSPGRD